MRYDKGWVKLHRSINRSWIARDGYALAIFATIINWANYEPSKIKFKGKIIELNRGQIITSIAEIARALGWEWKVVERRLQLLSDSGFCEIQRSNHGTIVTICNYDKYQQVDSSESKTTVRTTVRTTAEPECEPRPTYKEDKKERTKEVIPNNKTHTTLVDIRNTLGYGKSPFSFNPDLKEFIKYWNERVGRYLSNIEDDLIAKDQAKVAFMESAVKREGLLYWKRVIETCHDSTFMQGGNTNKWTANVDWVLKNHEKIMSGKYGKVNQTGKPYVFGEA